MTLCDPMDCSPPGSSVHGILQARILEWVAIPLSRESSQPRNQTQVSYIAGVFTVWATEKPVWCDRQQFVPNDTSQNVCSDDNFLISEVNESSIMKDGREGLGWNCCWVLVLPVKWYSVIRKRTWISLFLSSCYLFMWLHCLSCSRWVQQFWCTGLVALCKPKDSYLESKKRKRRSRTYMPTEVKNEII